ncbi:hypothetical protein PR048_012020 [Dryococelus australis]|uniref:Uncharacterized protein n=1 Tax=Dryococelus australis TaxID=614101 RepID=A0ABQ9HNF7_9NEOP|nr:hypothetical protein PR048_012020 [Dryococelus australis]
MSGCPLVHLVGELDTIHTHFTRLTRLLTRHNEFCDLMLAWNATRLPIISGGATVAARLARSPPTKVIRVTGFWQVGIVPDDAVGRWVFSVISHFPRPFIPALLHTSITLIGSQDLAVKNRPNLFTSLFPLSVNERMDSVDERFNSVECKVDQEVSALKKEWQKFFKQQGRRHTGAEEVRKLVTTKPMNVNSEKNVEVVASAAITGEAQQL